MESIPYADGGCVSSKPIGYTVQIVSEYPNLILLTLFKKFQMINT